MDALRSLYETLNAVGLGSIWEISLAEFGFATLILGGAAAWLAGRGVASAWEPLWKSALWMLPLSLAVRFIHYAIFSGTLQLNPAAATGVATTLHYYLVDLAVLILIAIAGHRRTQSRMMARQYAWLYEPAGPFGWKARG